MKRFIITTLLILTWCSGQGEFYPQDEYYGGGIGYSPIFLLLNYGQISGFGPLDSLGLDRRDFDTPFVIHGGEGFAHMAGRWRLGGYAGLGSSRISTIPDIMLYIDRNGLSGYQAAGDTAIAYQGLFTPSIEAKFTLLLGAATVEYVVPLFRDLEVATGALLGIGRVNLSINQSSGTSRWNDQFSAAYGEVLDGQIYAPVDTTGFGADVQSAFASVQGGLLTSQNQASRLNTLSGTFFNLQPYVALKWQILNRVGLRLSLGYNKGTIRAGRWYLNEREPISDSPETVFKGLSIRTMLYFGL